MTVNHNDQRRSVKQFHLKTVPEDANVSTNISHSFHDICTRLVQVR